MKTIPDIGKNSTEYDKIKNTFSYIMLLLAEKVGRDLNCNLEADKRFLNVNFASTVEKISNDFELTKQNEIDEIFELTNIILDNSSNFKEYWHNFYNSNEKELKSLTSKLDDSDIKFLTNKKDLILKYDNSFDKSFFNETHITFNGILNNLYKTSSWEETFEENSYINIIEERVLVASFNKTQFDELLIKISNSYDNTKDNQKFIFEEIMGEKLESFNKYGKHYCVDTLNFNFDEIVQDYVKKEISFFGDSPDAKSYFNTLVQGTFRSLNAIVDENLNENESSLEL